MVVAAVAVAAALFLQSSASGPKEVSFPPPFPTELATRVLAAHAKDAAAAGTAAPGFVAKVAALEADEDANDPGAVAKVKSIGRSAPKVRTNLGPDGWRGLTSLLAIQAVDRVEAKPAGAFFSRVLQPTGVLDAQGEGQGEGWQALAQVLHRVRILRLALASNEDPETVPLSDDERRLYYRWKIERADKSTRAVRITALRRLRGLDPDYPYAQAEMHIIRGK